MMFIDQSSTQAKIFNSCMTKYLEFFKELYWFMSAIDSEILAKDLRLWKRRFLKLRDLQGRAIAKNTALTWFITNICENADIKTSSKKLGYEPWWPMSKPQMYMEGLAEYGKERELKNSRILYLYLTKSFLHLLTCQHL